MKQLNAIVNLVQEHKEVVLLHKASNQLFGGDQARNMIGLPYGERGKIYTKNIPNGYVLFIQSTSVNRKLLDGTRFLYEVDYR